MMLLNRKHRRSLQIFWTIVAVLTIAGMVLLYLPTLFG